ncbi:MAG: hypothetical protein ABIR71_14490 [Chthoniobacterales bacterium]
MLVVLVLSFTAAGLCINQAEAKPAPSPDAQKTEAEAAKVDSSAKPAAEKTAKPAAAKADAKMAPAATAAAAPMSPQMGTWTLNEAKSKLAPATGKNTTVVYSAAAKEMTKVTVEGVDKDGKPTKGTWVGKFDGKAYPVKGNLAYDSVMYKMVNERTNDISTMKDGKVAWTGKIEVAKDGKSRVVTVNGTDADGKKFKSTAVYDKK